MFFSILRQKGFEQRVVLRVKPNEAGFAELGETIFYSAEPGKMIVFGVDGKRLSLSAQQSNREPY